MNINKNKTIFATLCICGAMFTIALLYFLIPKQSMQAGLGVNNRVMKNDVLKALKIKEFDVDLYTPITEFGEKLYMYASSAGYILVLDSSLSIQQTIGKYGAGPGETDFLNDIMVNEEGVHLIDRQGKILIFNHSGHIVKEFKIDQTPIRAIHIAHNKWFIKSSSLGTNTDEEFQIYSPEGRLRVLFQRQIPENDADIRDEQVDGELIRNNAGKFFRVSQFCGQFLCFDESGKMLYNVRTVDATPLPQYRKTGNADDVQVFRSEGARMINPSATADKEYLYILSNAPSPKIKDAKFGRLAQLVIDMYEVSNGNYICSFMAPNYKKDMIPKIIYRYSQGMIFVYDYNILLYAEMDFRALNRQQQ